MRKFGVSDPTVFSIILIEGNRDWIEGCTIRLMRRGSLPGHAICISS